MSRMDQNGRNKRGKAANKSKDSVGLNRESRYRVWVARRSRIRRACGCCHNVMNQAGGCATGINKAIKYCITIQDHAPINISFERWPSSCLVSPS